MCYNSTTFPLHGTSSTLLDSSLFLVFHWEKVGPWYLILFWYLNSDPGFCGGDRVPQKVPSSLVGFPAVEMQLLSMDYCKAIVYYHGVIGTELTFGQWGGLH